MRRASTWPELDRLCRFVRAADSLTDTLATWTGRGIEVQIVRRVDRVFPEPTLAERLDLHDDARVQEREVRIRCADVVLAEARSWVAVESPALTPAARQSLRADGGLGDLLRPLSRRRSTLRVTACRTTPAHDPSVPVLLVQARLDVAGTPVAWCEETSTGGLGAKGTVGGPPRRGARPPRSTVDPGCIEPSDWPARGALRRGGCAKRRDAACTGQPNRVTCSQRGDGWIACAGQISQGVLLPAVLTGAVAVVPTLIVVASVVNREAYWRATGLDRACLALAGVALVVLLVSAGDLAIAMGITARGLGAVPTVVKAFRAPGTEQLTAFTAGVAGAACTLLSLEVWTFRTAGFAIYFLVFCGVMSWLLLRPRAAAPRTGTRSPRASLSGAA